MNNSRFATLLIAALIAALAAAGAGAMGRRPKSGPGGKMDPKEAATVDVNPSEWRGMHCGEEKPSARIIESGAEWERLWREAVRQPAPNIDFSQLVAAAIFLGSKPTGGYGVDFIEPLSDGKELVLRYKARTPKGMVTQAFTQPYAIKLYRKSGLKVSLTEVKE